MKTRTHTLLAKTLHGLEPLLVEELRQLGGHDIEPLTRAVRFRGDQRLLYLANLCCRTAVRILRPLDTAMVANEQALYQFACNIPWPDLFDRQRTFAVYSSVHSYRFTHSKFVALKVKDAIADRFRKYSGQRPSVDTRSPDIVINVHLSGQECTLSLDSSGESLHKRGYRQHMGAASLSEILAAGLLLHSGWDGQTPLYDPMCGAGTIVTEAALLASRIPSGWHRKGFSFMHWPDFNASLWQSVRAEAERQIRLSKARIHGSDISNKALAIARQNVTVAGVDDVVRLRHGSFWDLKPVAEKGMLIMNPPYGERLKPTDIENFYKKTGDHLKQHYQGWTAWILSANREALKHIGLRPSRKLTLFNGQLECRFQRYELYAGSKKAQSFSKATK